MAFSTQSAVSDGTLVTLLLTINYIDQPDVTVFVDDVEQVVDVDYEWTTDSSITFLGGALADGASVLLVRRTQLEHVLNIFAQGATFNNATMDENFQQLLYVGQEAQEGGSLTDVFNDVDMHGNTFLNLAPAVAPTSPVTLAQLNAYAADSAAVLRQDLAAAGGSALVEYGGSTVEAALDALNAEARTPQSFGVVGDGVTDDTAAWATWEAASGPKVIPAGDYLVSGVVLHYLVTTYVNTVNNNHAAGYRALESVTTGQNNTAFGGSAMQKTNGVLPLGSNNVAVGAESLFKNVGGYRNVAVGYQALHEQVGALTYGNSNVAVGYQNLYNNTLGKDNTAVGYLAMFFNTEGGGNTVSGYRALYNNIGVADTTGQFNTAMGYEVMLANTFGNSNTAYGWRGLFSNTTGTRNTAVGQEALRNNVTGTNNVAVGYKASHEVNANDTVAVGYQALMNNTAALNVAVGKDSLLANTSGGSNTAVGYQALNGNTTASLCTAVGRGALLSSSGSTNTALGYNALTSNSTFFNCTGLGAAAAVTASNQVQLGDSATTTYVYGTVQNRSDLRDKADVEDTELGIDFVMGLRAVSGRWDMREDYHVVNEDGTLTVFEKDGSRKRNRRHQWFIAQEVAELCESLGVEFGGLQHHTKTGGDDVYSLGYDEFIPPTVKAVQQCWARLDEIEARLAKLESA